MKAVLLALLLSLLQACSTHYPLSCAYSAQGPEAPFEEHSACAAPGPTHYLIAPEHLAAVSFDEDGLATLLINQQWLYLHPSGRNLAVVHYDNGPDYFSEGLVRAHVNGRIGYFDQQLQPAIAPRYDWAWPFEQGRALVCIDCQASVADADGHRHWQGGRWGYINHNGDEVVPLRFSPAQIYRYPSP